MATRYRVRDIKAEIPIDFRAFISEEVCEFIEVEISKDSTLHRNV